jgi:hypothetical protein
VQIVASASRGQNLSSGYYPFRKLISYYCCEINIFIIYNIIYYIKYILEVLVLL